ncbi:MAG: hypothetical protein A2008_01455 [Candidatus Wallbacteria bacterium GWC2_49_35]|uniref:Uncharacterized protein n=1 Tax=Candidatus Wallbacteria bacterium GWC2_49_35 TaxID=1817813 RepID=A0A1F7WLP1_9BACT|nr:MAG: hypothetical protein A2008_01455 [Candidatus Wallbacteria bacterium GWC2_49_35]
MPAEAQSASAGERKNGKTRVIAMTKNTKNKIKVETEKMPACKNKASGKSGIERGFGGEEGPSAFPLPRIALKKNYFNCLIFNSLTATVI